MNTIELNKVRKTYDQFVAVDDLSFSIEQGAVFGLLGPNGAGKTSSIRMMIGITAPDAGSINVFGQPFERKALHRIGYLPEERGLYKKMKILDQLIFLGELHGLSVAVARQKAISWSERLEISEWLPKKVEELSKGMQQKIQFVATLLHDPEFIIMDEPFGGLDPVNATLLKDVLLDLKKQGKTILFSTHRMDQVEKLCDAICLINHGKAVLNGNLKEIKAGYGKNNVQIEYEGDAGFLQQTALITSFNDYGNYVEAKLAPGADPQQLLRLVVERARVTRFELMEPSLEEIFTEVVGKTDA
ncbi:MAG TPA: ATP-binding cassette domain-containing protein [Candidatus Angelobacter sp.]|nr:ATP-binding cassette domain-containing protein [Candidatus Angelobacter sp.]